MTQVRILFNLMRSLKHNLLLGVFTLCLAPIAFCEDSTLSTESTPPEINLHQDVKSCVDPLIEKGRTFFDFEKKFVAHTRLTANDLMFAIAHKDSFVGCQLSQKKALVKLERPGANARSFIYIPLPVGDTTGFELTLNQNFKLLHARPIEIAWKLVDTQRGSIPKCWKSTLGNFMSFLIADQKALRQTQCSFSEIKFMSQSK